MVRGGIDECPPSAVAVRSRSTYPLFGCLDGRYPALRERWGRVGDGTAFVDDEPWTDAPFSEESCDGRGTVGTAEFLVVTKRDDDAP